MFIEPVPHEGLESAEAARRLETHGANVWPSPPPPTWLSRLVRQFRSPLVYILLAALVIETISWFAGGADGWPLEIIAIGVTLALNAALGAVQEQRSDRALARLQELAAPRAWVVRDGKASHVLASEIVPGDLLRLEAGDRVAADAVVLDAPVLLDESILTGESMPVERRAGEDVASGTMVVRGKTHARVSRTGHQSAVGKLAYLIAGLELGKSPLESRLEKLGRQIAIATLAAAALLVITAVAIEGPSQLPSALLLAVALAVAAVPEELPAVLTLTLALGVERMAHKNALVRRLSAVEALGSVTVIATDKTGTLTENRIRVERLESDAPDDALRAMVLANDADPDSRAGDPLELALLDHAAEKDLDAARLHTTFIRVSETPFDSEWKYMRATVRDEEGKLRSYLKGAPEALLPKCRLSPAESARWHELAAAEATRGHRVLAFATREGEGDDGLTFCGLAALWDPPRPEVPDAIRRAQGAGVRVIMITGDHPATARTVAETVGLPTPVVMTGAELDALTPSERTSAVRRANVFARVSPAHKLELVEALKADGEIVAVTGDGVNDAPALKRADVGIAMGKRGSDVTREVASIVLLDDDFASIVSAIEEGRSLYENIQKFIRFMFSTSLGFLILVLAGAAGSLALGLRAPTGELLLPLTALQILWINFLADGPPAFALGLDKNPGVLDRPPRSPTSPLLDRPSLRFILVSATAKAGVGLLMLIILPLFGHSLIETQAAVFGYEFLAQLAFADPSRRVSVRPLANAALRWTLLAGLAVQLGIFTFPPLRSALGLARIDLALAASVGALVLVTFIAARGIAAWSGAADRNSRGRRRTRRRG